MQSFLHMNTTSCQKDISADVFSLNVEPMLDFPSVRAIDLIK